MDTELENAKLWMFANINKEYNDYQEPAFESLTRQAKNSLKIYNNSTRTHQITNLTTINQITQTIIQKYKLLSSKDILNNPNYEKLRMYLSDNTIYLINMHYSWYWKVIKKTHFKIIPYPNQSLAQIILKINRKDLI